jgi:hypothetical protein
MVATKIAVSIMVVSARSDKNAKAPAIRLRQ